MCIVGLSSLLCATPGTRSLCCYPLTGTWRQAQAAAGFITAVGEQCGAGVS
jgi:hypothetical protein